MKHRTKNAEYQAIYRMRKNLRGLCAYGGCERKVWVLVDARTGQKHKRRFCRGHSSSYGRRGTKKEGT